jgi:hypothetical protein
LTDAFSGFAYKLPDALQKSEQTGTGFRLKAAGDFGRSGT